MKKSEIKFYSKNEEQINVLSHALGIVISIVALVLLSIRSAYSGDVTQIVSSVLFGVSLIILYTASTLYHNAKDEKVRRRLKVFDHCAIYVLIAGTYTPYTLVVLESTTGWVVFGCSWGFALAGIILKLFFTGRFSILSTVMYVLMGWMIIFAIKPLIANLSEEGMLWLFTGGIFYTVGAVLYSIKKIPLNHGMFHVLALLGSVSHFISLYFYVL